ncbi:MAG: Gfo/Idh/MocA family oxidoreductase [Desulfobacteraceae bacterium]|nr:Gfo/Idh/MocA family oxidoreductase [Desulfobacteraceae bacterium]
MAAENSKPFDLIIVGAGMYACGKGTNGYGTILPAAFEACRRGWIKTIHIAAATKKSADLAKEKAIQLKDLTKVSPEIHFYPKKDDDPHAYLCAAEKVGRPCAGIISVPDNLHFEITKALIQKKIHVQVVKPLVSTVDENNTLIELKNQYGIYGCVEYHKRFDESNLKLYGLIRQGALGELLHFRINYSQRKLIPTTVFRNWVETTNVFQYLGVHYVDLIQFLTGAKPLRVMSMGMKKYLSGQGINTYDTIQTLIEWQQDEGKGCFLSSHLTGWVDPNVSTAMSDQRLEVIGTRGRYRSDQKNRGVTLVTDDHGCEEINPYFCQFFQDIDGQALKINGYGPGSILQFINDCVNITNGKKSPAELQGLRASFESSLYIAMVLEASAKSLAEGNTWISVNKSSANS